MDEYLRSFWVLIGALFIDRVGGALFFHSFHSISQVNLMLD